MRVNDPHENATWVYEYDRGGNITFKKKYAYTTGTLGTVQQTIPYVYSDSTWKDKLTSYNGTTITYDTIGNPLSDGTWTYTWQAGRQLKTMVKTGMTVEFKYDHNGLRTEKKVIQNGVVTTTNYILHGNLVTHMTVSSDKMHFFYDNQQRPAKVSYNGITYTYLHNLQGDIVGIVDNNGTLVVEYIYDAWGEPLSIIGSKSATLGKLNPFRYRGYVYDCDTHMYYLNQRYYSSVLCRFINGDIVINNAHLLGLNIMTYCYNSPVLHLDPTGMVACEALDLGGPIVFNDNTLTVPRTLNVYRNFGEGLDIDMPLINTVCIKTKLEPKDAKEIHDRRALLNQQWDTTGSIIEFIASHWINSIVNDIMSVPAFFSGYSNYVSDYVASQTNHTKIAVYDASAIRDGLVYVVVNNTAPLKDALSTGWSYFGIPKDDLDYQMIVNQTLYLPTH